MSGAEALGRVVGTLLVLAVVTVVPGVWAIRLRRRESPQWWIPAVVGAVLVVILAGALLLRPGGSPVERVDAAAILERVEGFTLEALAPEAAAEIEDRYRSDPALGEHVEQVLSRSAVGDDGVSQGNVLIVALDPEAASEPGQEEGLGRGLADASGSPAIQSEIAGEGVVEVDAQSQGAFYVAWQHQNLFLTVIAADAAGARALAAALIAASRA
jgi:hypothetical protein